MLRKKFSLTEIGQYDVPACVDYIVKWTKRKSIFYLGHSRGTSDFFVMMSERPEYNEKIKLGVLFAPIVYMKDILNPMITLVSAPEKELRVNRFVCIFVLTF